MTIIVTTQTELDAALATDNRQPIIINSRAGVWLTIDGNRRHPVEAGGSATVEAGGSATVRAGGSATVEAWGSATVEAGGSATVRAWDRATVRAGDRATVEAGCAVAVHLHSAQATIHGGVIIDITQLDLTDPVTWCSYHGVHLDGDGIATLYKAVQSDWTSPHGWDYQPGTIVGCDDFQRDQQCGHGLHVSPRPRQALGYLDGGERDGGHFLAIPVRVTDLDPISDDKAKFGMAAGPTVEVDIDGRPISTGGES